MTDQAKHFNSLFTRCTADYRRLGDLDHPPRNPFDQGSLDYLLYHKNQVDNVQWDLEDLIRDPEIDPAKALVLKRRIDASNQLRTDLVEQIDDRFLETYRTVQAASDARLNTESIAWALDRLSILVLKIHHMQIQAAREEAGAAHREKCAAKLQVLMIQQQDLVRAIDELLEDVAAGKRVMKVYRQMKMYNDPALNPVLYRQNSSS
jgi:hypothetical protein